MKDVKHKENNLSLKNATNAPLGIRPSNANKHYNLPKVECTQLHKKLGTTKSQHLASSSAQNTQVTFLAKMPFFIGVAPYPFEILNANQNSLHERLREKQNNNTYELASSQSKLREAKRPPSFISFNV